MSSLNYQKKDIIKLILLATLCCFLWATAIPTLKISYQLLNIPKEDLFNRFILAGMRFLLAGILIGIYIFIKEKKITLVKGKLWKTVIIFGILNTTLQYMFFYTGVGNTGAIKGVLIDTSKPMMVVILAHFLIGDDKITRNKLIGLLLGTIGILIANIEGVVGGGLDFNLTLRGEGALLLSSFVYSLAVVYSKKVMKKIPSQVLNMHQFVIGASILLVTGLIGAGGFHLIFTLPAALLLVYSSFLSAIAFVVWYNLIHEFSASRVSVFMFLTPVFGSIISSTIFPEEHLTVYIFISLILTSCSIYLVNTRQKKILHRLPNMVNTFINEADIEE